ncbi:hypothetical protein TNCV_4219281 [Trichonephila clavipes]|nr:hypothetical protein TNCV_4219281 [Trichonephila clavipes]
MYSRWVPQQLSEEHKKRIEWAFDFNCLVHRNNILEANNLQMTTTFDIKSYCNRKKNYAAGIEVLIKRWDGCINVAGDYEEK